MLAALSRSKTSILAGQSECLSEIMHPGKKTCLSGSQLSRYGRRMMIVCANSKGGVGKSTLATHLAVWLFDQGFQTALLDTDKQRSSSQWIAEAEPQIDRSGR